MARLNQLFELIAAPLDVEFRVDGLVGGDPVEEQQHVHAAALGLGGHPVGVLTVEDEAVEAAEEEMEDEADVEEGKADL